MVFRSNISRYHVHSTSTLHRGPENGMLGVEPPPFAPRPYQSDPTPIVWGGSVGGGVQVVVLFRLSNFWWKIYVLRWETLASENLRSTVIQILLGHRLKFGVKADTAAVSAPRCSDSANSPSQSLNCLEKIYDLGSYKFNKKIERSLFRLSYIFDTVYLKVGILRQGFPLHVINYMYICTYFQTIKEANYLYNEYASNLIVNKYMLSFQKKGELNQILIGFYISIGFIYAKFHVN